LTSFHAYAILIETLCTVSRLIFGTTSPVQTEQAENQSGFGAGPPPSGSRWKFCTSVGQWTVPAGVLFYTLKY